MYYKAVTDIPAAELHCGHVFSFRGEEYLCQSNVMVEGNSIAFVTCTKTDKYRNGRMEVFVLRLWQGFPVGLIGRTGMELVVIDHDAAEKALIAELQSRPSPSHVRG